MYCIPLLIAFPHIFWKIRTFVIELVPVLPALGLLAVILAVSIFGSLIINKKFALSVGIVAETGSEDRRVMSLLRFTFFREGKPGRQEGTCLRNYFLSRFYLVTSSSLNESSSSLLSFPDPEKTISPIAST
uniref:Uncharacterized protein n=1 Tax=Nothobranchius furzeri TaxID=105023 RepID=A0A8C6NTM8_NOTFU